MSDHDCSTTLVNFEELPVELPVWVRERADWTEAFFIKFWRSASPLERLYAVSGD